MFTKVQLPDLRLNKCKLTFRLDNRASLSIRYFCAYHTLNISAQKTDITLFKSPDSQEIESILGKELIGRYDPNAFGKNRLTPSETTSSEKCSTEQKNKRVRPSIDLNS